MRNNNAIIALFATMATITFIGCSPAAPGSTEGSRPPAVSNSKPENSVVGSWEGQGDAKEAESKISFEFKSDGKYTMVMYPENSEVHISGSYKFEKEHLEMNAEAVDMVNLPADAAKHEAEIEKNFLEEMKKEDLNSDVSFEGANKMFLTVKGDKLELTKK